MPQEIKIRSNDPQYTLSKAINSILIPYGDSIKGGLEKALTKIGKEGAQKLRQAAASTFPTGRRKCSGVYAKGWSSTVETKRTGPIVKIHNRTKPGLAHLLEHGHPVVRGGETIGDAPAYVHIAPVAAELENKALSMVAQEVKKV
jgi:hypothetical protein